MEVFEINFLFLFHSDTHFSMAYILFYKHAKIFDLDGITNKTNKYDDKKWPYRMLIIGPSGSGKLMHYLI